MGHRVKKNKGGTFTHIFQFPDCVESLLQQPDIDNKETVVMQMHRLRNDFAIRTGILDANSDSDRNSPVRLFLGHTQIKAVLEILNYRLRPRRKDQLFRFRVHDHTQLRFQGITIIPVALPDFLGIGIVEDGK